jgi:hypothetical protein
MTFLKTVNRQLPLILLIMITFLITVSNLFWVKINQAPIFDDTAGHTNLSIIFSHVIKGEGKEVFHQGIIGFLKTSDYYPPFVLIIGSFINLIFGYYYKNLQYFSVLLLPFTSLFLYLYAKQLTKNRWIGFFSAALFILFPHIWQQSRHFMLDLPLTTLVIASLCFLNLSKHFKEKKYGFLFFLFGGLAQLTKWYAFVYLFIPFLTKLFPISKKKIKAILPYFFLTCLLVLPWYAVNYKTLLNKTLFFSTAHFANQPMPFSLRSLLFYPTMLLNYQIVSLQFIWLLIALMIFFKSKNKLRKFFFAQISFVFLLFTLLGNKNLRFIMPLLPFFAIIMGYSLEKTKGLGRFIFIVLFLFGIGLLSINSFSFPFKSNLLLAKQFSPDLDYVYFLDLSSKTVPYHWQKTSWSPEIVVNDLKTMVGNKKTKILVAANNQTTSVASIDVFSLANDYYLQFSQPPFDADKNIAKNVDAYIEEYDYLLIPKNFSAPDWQINFNNLEAIKRHVLGGQTRKFTLVKTYNLPNDKLYLLKNEQMDNKLKISIKNNQLVMQRSAAVARIYFQLMDENDNWSQEYMTEKEIEYKKEIENIKIIRIDYPAGLWMIEETEGWNWDRDKQLNRI